MSATGQQPPGPSVRSSATPPSAGPARAARHPALSPLVLLIVTSSSSSIVNPRFIAGEPLSLLVQQAAVVGALAVGSDPDHPDRRHRPLGRRHRDPVDDGHGQAAANTGSPACSRWRSGSPSVSLAGCSTGSSSPAQAAAVHRHPGHARLFTAIALLYAGGQTQDCRLPDLLIWTGETLRDRQLPHHQGVLMVLSVRRRRLRAEPHGLGHGTSTPWVTTPEAARLAGIRATGCCSASTRSPALIFGIGGLGPHRPRRRREPQRDHRRTWRASPPSSSAAPASSAAAVA